MTASLASNPPRMGFLTVVESGEQGLIGGYLIVNVAGRPLEFHCTAPVRANRAQEILYGPTLQPYLFGEQIGHALVCRSKLTPSILFTDREPVMSLRTQCQTPLVLIQIDQTRISDRARNAAESTPLNRLNALERFQLGRNTAAARKANPGDRQSSEQLWDEFSLDLDLAEPFERIREAIQEARRAA